MLQKIGTPMLGVTVGSNGGIVSPGSSFDSAFDQIDTSLVSAYRGIGIIGLGGNDYFKVEDLADETAALAAAVDGQKIVYARKSYDRTSPLLIPAKSIDYIMDGAHFNILANTQAIYARSGITGLFSLAQSYVPGSLELVINVTVGVLSNYYKRGRWFKIVSNAIDPTNRNEGTQANQWRLGEWCLIYDVDDVNNKIILASPLRFWQGLDGQLTPPDATNRATVETYTTQNNARVFTPIDVSLGIYGGVIDYEEGHAGSGGWTATAVDVGGWQGVNIDGLRIMSGYGTGVGLGCAGAVLNNIRVDHLADQSREGGTSLGYAVGDGGGYTTITGLRGFNCRHVVTSTGSSNPADSTNVGLLLGWGKQVGTSVIGAVGGGQKSTTFDTHSGAVDWSFVDCIAVDGNSLGFHARGRGIKFIRPVSKCRQGIQALVEWQNGGGSDLPGPSGKGRDVLTTCHIESPTIICQRDALISNGSLVNLTGVSDIVSGSHDVFSAIGGGILDIVDGSHRVKINGTAMAVNSEAANRGIVNTTLAPTQFGITGFQGFRISRGARVDIDAASAIDTNPMRLYNGVSGTGMEVHGGCNAVLNNNFDRVENGGNLVINQFADWSITGTTAIREASRYFRTYPDGSWSGCGRVVALADDGVTYIDLPCDSGIFELTAYDNVVLGGIAQSLGVIMSFADPTSSTSERADLIPPGNTTYVEVVGNTDFAIAGTDGKLCLSNRDNGNTSGTTRIYINNRLGAAISFHWVLRSGNIQGL